MEDTRSPRRVEASLPPVRKTWMEPAILLERSLEAAAEGTPPGERRGARERTSGFLGPLAASPRSAGCKI